ncbi:MAG: glycosyltransferase family 4 protein [Planctomycetaceae bacterium]|nr:glycosyltransferase family 4 protein [Planctomycetaceae bacterium]
MTEKLRVLFMVDHAFIPRSGSELHLVWLQSNLDPERFEKFFLVFSQRDCPPDMFPVPSLTLGQIFGNTKLTLFKRFRALVRFLCDHNIDVIHAFTPNDEVLACYAVLFARRKLGRMIPVVGHRRNIGYMVGFKRHLMGHLIRRFNIPYLANSHAAVEAAFALEGIPRERFTVIYNPFSRSRWEDGLASPVSRAELALGSGDFVIGSVATIRRIKGYETLVQAARLVVDRYPNVRFLCIGNVGDPEYHSELQSLTAKLGLERHFLWHGGMDNPYRVLPVFDLAVLSSYSESFSNSVLEYAAAGLPIVASNVGGMSEIMIDGENGFLVPPKQPELLAEKINMLIENPALRRTFAERAAETARRDFDESAIARQYAGFYENLCHPRPSGPQS